MPSYKLYYFEARGLAEMSRMLFAEAGVEYEDIRIAEKDWPKLKPKMPFGHMPVLYVDNEAIGHSRAIVRYLAREFKLEGENPIAAAQVDAWIETFFEIFQKLPFEETDPIKQAEQVAAAMKETIGPRFRLLEAQIKNKGGPFVMGKELFETLAKRPGIADWITARPITEY